MTSTRGGKITTILQSAQGGNRDAAERLLPVVYDELRKLATARMAKLPPGQTLQPTALVHEAYVRLLGKRGVRLENRKHFFFLAARAMRDLLVEQARAKAGPKRGGGRKRLDLDDVHNTCMTSPSEEVLAVHDALAELENEDPLKVQIVNLR